MFSRCDQIRRKVRIWSCLLKKSLIENFIFCVQKLRFFADVINFEINHSFLIKPFPNITKLVRTKIFKHFLSESTHIPRNLHVDFSERILIPKLSFKNIPKFDIFEKAIFCTVVSSTNLVLRNMQIGSRQYKWKRSTFFDKNWQIFEFQCSFKEVKSKYKF